MVISALRFAKHDELEHDGQRFLDLDAVPKDDRLAHEPTLT
jgi:hypothetical protein